jgi:hypothetical protein
VKISKVFHGTLSWFTYEKSANPILKKQNTIILKYGNGLEIG